jgi:UDP-sugar transporter A1/2/3
MVKQVNFGDTPVQLELSRSHHNQTVASGNSNLQNKNMNGFDLSINGIFILIQTVCSCLAGVYNEYLLKNQGSDINIYIQNVYMYIDSIICNALILLLRGELFSAFTLTKLSTVFKFNVIIIMVNNCAIGIVTSFFLKYLNSILKTFASAVELIFTAILSYFLFSIPIYINTILSIFVVSTAAFIYSQHPVQNKSKNFVIKEDSKALLSDDSDTLQMEQVLVK